MSSDAFETIFDLGAEIVKQRLGESAEIVKTIEDFRRRIQTDDRNPLENRDLIVEPNLDSQILVVPRATVEKIAAEFHKLNILHVWVRVRCPSVEEDDEATVVETKSTKEFRKTLQHPCPHCMQLHEDVGWDCLETFYAFNFDTTPDRFKLGKFFRSVKPLPGPKQTSEAAKQTGGLRGLIASFFPKGPTSPVKEVTAALETNTSVQQLPSPKETVDRVWVRASWFVFLGILITVLVALVNVTWAIIVAVAIIIALLLLGWFTWYAIWAAARLERRVLTGGLTFSGVLLCASSGLQFTADAKNTTSSAANLDSGNYASPMIITKVAPEWGIHFEFGETNTQLVWAAVVVFLCTIGIVYKMNSDRLRR